ncbi:MAG: MlaD family protein [Candidatus Gastranaerophilales bacterium]|nr:MlaD family protein [Candidatus Gastranaerophilales bacterium]
MKKKHIHLIEVTIWLIIISLISLIGIYIAKENFAPKEFYHVKFKDVDGLIVGSPVRMMGIQIGHVSQIKPIYDSVFLTFVVTKKDIKIPKNALVNVEFTGMAGSKSLEIAPCNNCHGFDVIEPIRVDYVMEAQNKLAEALLTTTKGSLEIFDNGDTHTYKDTINFAKKITEDMTNQFLESDKIIKEANQSVVNTLNPIKKSLEKKKNSLNFIQKQPENKKDNVENILKAISKSSQMAKKSLTEENLEKLNIELLKIKNNLNLINENMPQKKNLTEIFDKMSEKLENLPTFNLSQSEIDDIKNKLDEFNNSIESLMQEI